VVPAIALPADEALKADFQSSLAEAASEMLAEYVEGVLGSTELEDKRKFMTWASETLGWKRAAPKSDMDTLPVFNFNFGVSGQVQMTTVAPDGTQQTLEFTPDPNPAMQAAIAINEDVAFDD